MTKFNVKIENIVASAALGVDIALNDLVNASEDTEYEPEQFPGVIYRIKSPRAAALIFSTGKIICTGTKSLEDAKKATNIVISKMRAAGIDVPKKKVDVKIENIVASAKVKANINPTELTFSLENAEYEPQQFPGIVYRINKPRVTFLIFKTGRLICTGATSLDDVIKALESLKKKLESVGLKVKPE